MAEYIEKQAALKEVCDACGIVPDREKENCEYKFAGCKEYYNVFTLPPADVCPVKHGKWIVKTDSEGKTYGVCSCCGYEQYAGHLKYCPECGGKMDGPNQ